MATKAQFGDESGIFIRLDEKDRYVATFKGQIEFHHKVVDGHATSKLLKGWAEMYNTEIKREFDNTINRIEDEKQAVIDELRPCRDNKLPRLPIETVFFPVEIVSMKVMN